MDKTISSATDAVGDNNQAFSTNAARNAINRLLRCIFAERILGPSALLWARDHRQAWFPLWPSRRVLQFSDLRTAPAGTLRNRGAIEVLDGTGASHRNNCPAALMREIAPCLARKPAPDAMEDLLLDVDESMRNDILARRHRQSGNAELREKIAESDASGFLGYLEANLPPHLAAMTLDQWGAYEGNPLYPTWKAKSGLPTADVIAFSPAFGARVSLRIAALRKYSVYAETLPHAGSYSEWSSQKFPDLWLDWVEGLKARNQSPKSWLPFTIHAWHLKNFVRREFAAESASGILHPDGAEIVTLPSISFRTMLPETTEPRPFIKLPVPIWMTSTQRNLSAKAVHMGPRLSALISGILSEAFWVEEHKAFLERPWPTRSVLRSLPERFRDYRVEHQLPNPLADT
nr:IucA/IucC family siderophore biosynthesis protein [Sinorhizobium sp. BJ1]